MKLRFISIHINNFKTIKRLDFKFDRPLGTYLLVGENNVEPDLETNGAGKSSIFDALCWVLYGKTPDGKRGPDLVPWGTNEQVSVSLVLDLSSGRQYVARLANPNKLLWGSGESKKQIDQDYVNRSVGLSFDTFVNTVLYAQRRDLFFDLTPTQKMQLFYDVLNLERWEERAHRASKRASELQTEVENAHTSIEATLATYHEVKDAHARQAKAFDTWEAELEKKLKSVEKDERLYQKRVRFLQDKYDPADLAYEGASVELKALGPELKQLREYIEHARVEVGTAKSRQEDARRRLAELQTQIKIARKRKCPMCGGPLKDGVLNQLEEKLRTAHLSSRGGEVDVATAALADLTNQAKPLIEAGERFTSQAQEARDILDTIGPQLAEAKAKLTQLTKERAGYEKADNPYSELERRDRKRRDTLKRKYEDESKRFHILCRKRDRVDVWVKGFKQIALEQIEDVLQELSLATDVTCEQMGLRNWHVTYAIEKETKKGAIKRELFVYIKSPSNDEPVRWECWSGGEGQRLRIAGAFALSEVLLSRAGIEPSLEILDEPSPYIAPKGVRDLGSFLHDRAIALNRNIFYVDQNAIENDRFASTIRVVRNDKGTRIV